MALLHRHPRSAEEFRENHATIHYANPWEFVPWTDAPTCIYRYVETMYDVRRCSRQSVWRRTVTGGAGGPQWSCDEHRDLILVFEPGVYSEDNRA